MDFLAANIGWFGGSFVIIALAIIGYLADKNEKEAQMKMGHQEPKYINPQMINTEVEEAEPVTMEQQIENKIEETIRKAEQPSYNDYENISMSLEDLEKKNYDKLLSDKENNVEPITQEQTQIPEIKENKPVEQVMENISEQPVENKIDELIENKQQETISETPQEEITNNMNYESEIPELFDNAQPQKQEMEQTPIPEPAQNQVNSYDSTDDDIWKF